MKFLLLILLQEIHVYLPMKGTLVLFKCNYVCIMNICTHRQRVESFILSSQISADPQRRIFLGGDNIKLTFNIGMV